MQTPWGISQTVRQIAAGIVSVSTAGHGGLWLSGERWKQLQAAYPFVSFEGPQWLEEDCDCCHAVIVWPEYFSPEAVFHAARMVGAYRPSVPGSPDIFATARQWLAGPGGLTARVIAAEFAASVAGKWERGGMAGDRHGWIVWMERQPAAGEAETAPRRKATILSQDYPANWMTDAEVAAGVAALDAHTRRQARENIAKEQRRADAALRQRQADCVYETDAAGMCYSDADPGL